MFIACLGVYYVWLLNQNATKGYNIRTLQMENRELAFRENMLNIRIAEGKSIDSIVGSDTVQKMEEAVNPGFLVIKDVHFTMNN